MSTKIKHILPFIALCSFFTIAQIGVGTLDPQQETLLDVYGESKGLLVPRINVTDFNTFTLPNGTHTESLLLFNTNTVLGEGFTFWNGTRWSHLNNSFFWGTYGDYDTSSSNLIGTSDATSFILGTNNVSRLTITTNHRFENFNLGSLSRPSWSIRELNNGFYTQLDDLRFGINGLNFLSVSPANGIIVNDSQEDIDFVINSTLQNIVSVEADLDAIGILSSDPIQETLHIQGSSSDVAIESLGNVNINNNGLDESLLYVDGNGQFKLEPTPHITQLPQFDYESGFLGSSVSFSNSTLGANSALIHTTNQVMFKDGLLEIVYQASLEVRSTSGGLINDGLPRKYGIRILVDGRIVGQTSKMYSSLPTASPTVAGFMYLNGKGYVPLTGNSTGINHTVEVEAFYDGGGNNTLIRYGASSNDLLQLIVHY